MGSNTEAARFAEMAMPHLDAAYNLARWLTRDPSDASDVVQEAMLRALRFFSSFRGGNGKAWLLVEDHCPICAAAAICQGLCRSELEIFARCLGRDVQVERVEHVLAGGRRCAYRVSAAG